MNLLLLLLLLLYIYIFFFFLGGGGGGAGSGGGIVLGREGWEGGMGKRVGVGCLFSLNSIFTTISRKQSGIRHLP